MLTWYTTTEWIALQFNGKHLEELNENETNIAKRLMDEGYLVSHQYFIYCACCCIWICNSKPIDI